ncbi:MAG TPA: hypothetical protein V6C91_00875 [Coleofasciculaceae cyanobacterium]
MQLYTPAELDQIQHDLPYLTEILEWTNNFLAKPHPDLGRSGLVCPFVPRSLKLNTIQLKVIRTQNLGQQQTEKIVSSYRDIFLQQEPREGEAALNKAILLIFPDIPIEDNFKLIDKIQQKLKPLFVEAGLMIGEFHKYNDSPGLHNPNFRPLRSPIPILAIRFMVEADLPFLQRLSDEPYLRVRYLEAYLQRMGKVFKDETKLKNARQALALAQTQLEQTLVYAGSNPSITDKTIVNDTEISVIPETVVPAKRCPLSRLGLIEVSVASYRIVNNTRKYVLKKAKAIFA